MKIQQEITSQFYEKNSINPSNIWELFHDRTNKFYGKNFQNSFMSIINNNKPELPIKNQQKWNKW